jgi:toxin ParE1/3/4
MMPVQVSGLVEHDLEDIGDYIAKHNPTRALSFIRELRDAVRGIGERPYLYRLYPEYGSGIRVRIHGNYLILFRIVAQTVFVDRVIQGSRNATNLR